MIVLNLKEIVKNYFVGKKDEFTSRIDDLKNYHLSIVKELFDKDEYDLGEEISEEFEALEKEIPQ